jgi:hypothetical protein
LYKIEYG